MKFATFNRFEIEFPDGAVNDCSHGGKCDEDVEYWAKEIVRPPEITPEKLATELKEYGAWDDEELKDDEANWRRIIWIGAGNIRDEMFMEEDNG